MLGMGLSLTLQDFKRVTVFPKAVIIGLICQVVLLPVLAFALMSVWEIKSEFAVGIILLAAVPGGPTSNLLAYLGKCDAALSITLTAISSLITIITIPFLVNYAMETFMGEGKFVALPVLKTMLQILVITIIPVSLGMFLNKRYPKTALRFQRPVKIASAVFITIIILGAVLKRSRKANSLFVANGRSCTGFECAHHVYGVRLSKNCRFEFQTILNNFHRSGHSKRNIGHSHHIVGYFAQ